MKPRGLVSRWVLGWIPFGIASALVFRGAILSLEEIPAILAHIDDKAIHGIEYTALFLFSVNAFRRAAQPWLTVYSSRLAFGYCLGMGVVTEFVQIYVPGRSCDFYDWVADALGAATAWFILSAAAGVMKISRRASDELL